MEKPHIKVIQRNGVDIFVTSSIKMKVPNKPINRRPSITTQQYREELDRLEREGKLKKSIINTLRHHNESTSDLWGEVIRDSERNKHKVRMDAVYFPQYHNE